MGRGPFIACAIVIQATCAHPQPQPEPEPVAAMWLDLGQLKPTDYVCSDGGALKHCATVAEVRSFLFSAKATP